MENLVYLSIGYLYPLYASTKALQQDDARLVYHWIAFWTIHFAFALLDASLGWLLNVVVPFYQQLRLLFLLALLSTTPRQDQPRSLMQSTLEDYVLPGFRHCQPTLETFAANHSLHLNNRAIGALRSGLEVVLEKALQTIDQPRELNAQQQFALSIVRQAVSNFQSAVSSGNLVDATDDAVACLPPPYLTKELSIEACVKSENVELRPSALVDEEDESEKKAWLAYSTTNGLDTGISYTKTTKVQRHRHLSSIPKVVEELLEGVELVYYSTDSRSLQPKKRILKLESEDATHLTFQTTNESNRHKSARLSLLNLGQVRPLSREEEIQIAAKYPKESATGDLDMDEMFLVANEKTTLVFQALTEMSRDRIVDGLQWLIQDRRLGSTDI